MVLIKVLKIYEQMNWGTSDELMQIRWGYCHQIKSKLLAATSQHQKLTKKNKILLKTTIPGGIEILQNHWNLDPSFVSPCDSFFQFRNLLDPQSQLIMACCHIKLCKIRLSGASNGQRGLGSRARWFSKNFTDLFASKDLFSYN